MIVNATFAGGVPFIAFYVFQLAFAIITPALVTGAFADRLNYRGYIIFTVLFTLLVYIPVCH
ncbi:ammonium transporter [bacterium]|nr:ammonium transporter [bacterium]MBR2857609.1 ammonium transporter [bacterium]